MKTTIMTYCWLQYVHYKENYLYVTNITFSFRWDFQVIQTTEGLLYFKHVSAKQEQISCHYIAKIWKDHNMAKSQPVCFYNVLILAMHMELTQN